MKAVHPEVLAVPRVNPGESLRKAREDRGWTVSEVAAQLNLTPQRLTQIEQGAFDQLPGHTFARGYVRAYAKLLEVDQNRLVLEFDQFTGSDAAGSSVHSLGRIEEPVSYSQHILRTVSFVLLLALAALGFYWWQEQAQSKTDDLAVTGIEQVEVDGADGTTQIHQFDEPEDQAVLAAQAGGEVSLPLLAAPGEEQPAAVVPAEPGTSESPLPAATTSAAAPAESTATQAESVASTPLQTPASTPPVAAGEALVSVTYVADCWTQLTDATGKVLFSALKRKGETLELAGKPPFELRLGFARGAQVSYNGQAVDVAPFVSGETARLKLGGL
ncbi:RodZ family helix-turn-helix domain-containing protein [Pseudomonas sp.]|uniref:RodZ family helix-turn-helix domain-containing protein n=1 Tax=Pseudomonas sp. TaxID=306 RepID=UPI002C4F8398|nr:RodZ family helix-turn-helix domain-containing protein [Pseudomonas sp.]HUE93147.1 RodZ family helix-turn-helix domain-containing protein [Pseudomonas sp.]